MIDLNDLICLRLIESRIQRQQRRFEMKWKKLAGDILIKIVSRVFKHISYLRVSKYFTLKHKLINSMLISPNSMFAQSPAVSDLLDVSRKVVESRGSRSLVSRGFEWSPGRASEGSLRHAIRGLCFMVNWPAGLVTEDKIEVMQRLTSCSRHILHPEMPRTRSDLKLLIN